MTEKVCRRRFLKSSGRCLAVSSILGGGVSGCTVPPRSFRADGGKDVVKISFDRYPELRRVGGILKVFFTRRRALYVRRDEADRVEAISAVCTHQGCIVAPSTHGFKCPCHGSTFDALGQRTGGPARAPLARFHVEIQNDSVIVHLRRAAGASG